MKHPEQPTESAEVEQKTFFNLTNVNRALEAIGNGDIGTLITLKLSNPTTIVGHTGMSMRQRLQGLMHTISTAFNPKQELRFPDTEWEIIKSEARLRTQLQALATEATSPKKPIPVDEQPSDEFRALFLKTPEAGSFTGAAELEKIEAKLKSALERYRNNLREKEIKKLGRTWGPMN